MRKLTDHKVNPANDKLEILVLDEPGAGGANHVYAVLSPEDVALNEDQEQSDPSGASANAVIANRGIIRFQNGPIAENGINGLTQEVLLAIVADRLRSFQAGQYACRENAVALTHIETAQLWLHKRTLERMQRGVEGTHQK